MEELVYSVMEERSFVKEQNKELSEKIAEMEYELENSHKFIDNLRHLNSHKEQTTSHGEKYKEWENAKNIYEEKILEMKAHILRIDTKAVDEANAAAKEVEELCKKVCMLEKLLNDRNHNSENIQSKSGNEKRIMNNTTRDVKIYSDPHSSSQHIDERRPAQVSLRSSVLRANGGEKSRTNPALPKKRNERGETDEVALTTASGKSDGSCTSKIWFKHGQCHG